MDALRRQRATVKGQITRIDTGAKSEAQIAKLKALKQRLEHYMLEYERIQSEIDILCDEDDDVENQYRSEIEIMYYNACATLSEKIEESRPRGSTAVPNDLNDTIQALVSSQTALNELVKGMGETVKRPITITKVDPHIRLPEIKIPEFTGNLCDWVRFRDLFTALVISKDSLSGIEKFEHLQTRLKGNALSIIKHLTPSNENFGVGWNLVKEHFDKPNLITNAHLDNIFNISVLKSNTLDELKTFFNTVFENLNALRALKQPVDSWELILVYVLVKKLDEPNNVLWIRRQKGKQASSVKDFTDFLKERIDELESLNVSRVKQPNLKTSVKSSVNKRVFASVVQSCIKCKRNHHLYQCEQFRELSVPARIEFMRHKQICINCLRSKHSLSECKFSVCRQCGQRHNSLLHDNNAVAQPTNDNANSVSVNMSQHVGADTFTLLPTAIILVEDGAGKLHKCRALLDSGSQATLISESCAQRLCLKRRHARVPITGIGSGGSVHGTRGEVNLVLHSVNAKTISISTNAYILSKLTSDLPSVAVPRTKINFFENLTLADPNYHSPAKIDILIGSGIFFDVLSEGKVVHPSGAPTAHKTVFGWVVAGNICLDNGQNIVCGYTSIDLDAQLKRFCEVEDCPEIQQPTNDADMQVEEHFMSTHTVAPDGRYVVRLPFKSESVEFGNSRISALKRLYAMERRFAQNEELKREYIQFLREYEALGHMKSVSVCEDQSKVFYLPHHAVIKSSSTTTKLRVVFDASNKSDNGVSLNDLLVVGPTIQNDLLTHLIKFRKYRVAIKADIAKMYRQVAVNDIDVDYQRIVWREDAKQEPRDYQLLTVTYGTASASFLATRVLKQVGVRSLYRYPNAGNSIINDFYVDDYMSGYDTYEDACQIKDEICIILSQSGMELRKWASNSADFLDQIDSGSRELSTDLPIGENSVKTLGLLWDTKLDSFKFSFCLPALASQITKRQVLSDIARIFDPMGWLSPTIIKMKIFMKKLWVRGIGWDSYIPSELYQEWSDFTNDLHHIGNVRIPRWISYQQGMHLELHGFADASESAYAAAIYSRMINPDGSVYTTLLCAKSRIAPVKPALTVPRLELCGSLLLTKLLSKVKEALGIHDVECFAYTDSTVVLHWIQGYPRSRNVFVDNRISQIVAQFPVSIWHHVRSAENPADCATRGIMPKHLAKLDLWWNGPDFLRDKDIKFAALPDFKENPVETEISCLVIVKETNEWDIRIFDRFSNLNRLLRVTARCILLARTLAGHRGRIRTHFLSPDDIRLAKLALFRLSQKYTFQDEISVLERGQAVSRKSKYISMLPFIDHDGVLRVGGRLENACIPFEQKHPTILHKDHPLTHLIVQDCHLNNLHAGLRQMTYLLSLNYSIIGIHQIIKRCIYQCVTCIRQRAIPYQQQMANLPKPRLEPGVTFGNTGVDYAGPFLIRTWKGRGAKQHKVYISLFVCMATKALHLELVSDLSSSAFIAALRRFVSRRGKCHSIYSDNGTNFVGANQQLRDWANLLNSANFQEDVSNELTSNGINWHFSPPMLRISAVYGKRGLKQPSSIFEEL